MIDIRASTVRLITAADIPTPARRFADILRRHQYASADTMTSAPRLRRSSAVAKEDVMMVINVRVATTYAGTKAVPRRNPYGHCCFVALSLG